MKRFAIMVVVVLFGLALVVPIIAQAATDFSKMSTEQLYQAKQQEQQNQIARDDRGNLDSEWIKRVVRMTPEQRQKYQDQIPWSDQEIQRMWQEHEAPSR